MTLAKCAIQLIVQDKEALTGEKTRVFAHVVYFKLSKSSGYFTYHYV